MKPHIWTLFIDGAARKNPGKAGAGVLIKRDDQVVTAKGFYLGIKTNNQAEYIGLLLALFFITRSAKPDDTITIISDSLLLVKQFKGEYRVKNEGLKPLHAIARFLAQGYPIDMTHVLREENSEADALANNGIDQHVPLPPAFVELLAAHNIHL
jgi:ribonuclease HI